MNIYVTSRGEYGEGGCVQAVHRSKRAAIRYVEKKLLPRTLDLYPAPKDVGGSIVAAWTNRVDFIEIERWVVR